MCLQEFQISSTVRGYSVRNLNMLPIFFKLSLLKLHLFAPKGYTIALQSEEKKDVYLMLWRKIRLQVVVEDFLTKQNPTIYVK
jgi:hypothetical protein